MKVTAVVFAYNQAAFIRQALDSVLAQQTTFEFELLIVEDRSTDGTREITLEYSVANPDKIRLLLSDVNMGACLVAARAISAAQGDYIAFLDGDDYWTSPAKLQKQVEFMDTHPDHSICWHHLEYVDVEGERLNHQIAHHSRTSWSLEDILEGVQISTCAILLRRSMLPPLPDWFFQCACADFVVAVLCLENGPAGYLDETLGAWRHNPKGFYSSRTSREQELLFQYTLRKVYRHFTPQRQAELARHFKRRWVSMAVQQRSSGDVLASRQSARMGLEDFPHDVRLQLLAHAPILYAPLRGAWLAWKHLFIRNVQDEA